MMFIWRRGGAESIADKVAIIGMGCMTFGENWEKSAEDMIVDAVYEAFEDAGASLQDIQAAWVGTTASGTTGQSLSRPLK
jgi:acetyl-CoA C-acetyltransferase